MIQIQYSTEDPVNSASAIMLQLSRSGHDAPESTTAIGHSGHSYGVALVARYRYKRVYTSSLLLAFALNVDYARLLGSF